MNQIWSSGGRNIVVSIVAVVFCCGVLVPSTANARDNRPTTGNHVCNCGCSYRGADGKFYFQNGHNISTNATCAELTVSNSTCEVKTGGRIYSGTLMGCSGDGSGGGPPTIQVPPTQRPGLAPQGATIPPPATR